MNAFEFNRLLKSNNEDERTRFNEHCLQIIQNYVRYRVDAEDFDDACYIILERLVMRKSDKFIGAPKKYISTCVHNYLVTYYKTREEYVPLNENINYEEKYSRLDYDDAMKTLLRYLCKPDADLIYMVAIQGYTYKEIAELSHKNVDAVRQRYHRKMKELKEKLEKDIKNVTND